MRKAKQAGWTARLSTLLPGDRIDRSGRLSRRQWRALALVELALAGLAALVLAVFSGTGA